MLHRVVGRQLARSLTCVGTVPLGVRGIKSGFDKFRVGDAPLTNTDKREQLIRNGTANVTTKELYRNILRYKLCNKKAETWRAFAQDRFRKNMHETNPTRIKELKEGSYRLISSYLQIEAWSKIRRSGTAPGQEGMGNVFSRVHDVCRTMAEAASNPNMRLRGTIVHRSASFVKEAATRMERPAKYVPPFIGTPGFPLQ